MSQVIERDRLQGEDGPKPRERLLFGSTAECGETRRLSEKTEHPVASGAISYPESPPFRVTNLAARNIDKEIDTSEQDPYLADFLRESAAFERLLPTLLEEAPGVFVAVLSGRVIDQDKDEFALAERVIPANPERFVLIRKVSREPDLVSINSPQVESP